MTPPGEGIKMGRPWRPIIICDPDRTQTYNLLIRSQMLYSIKLRGLLGCGCDGA